MTDLIVQTPCNTIEAAITGVIKQHKKLGIKPIEPRYIGGSYRGDGDVFTKGHRVLAAHANTYSHALVVLDAVWGGEPSGGATTIEADVEKRLETHWGNRARCIAIEPEVEAWIWSKSNHVASVLGWDSLHTLESWLIQQGLLESGELKPKDPKEAYIRSIRDTPRRPRSPYHLNKLARKVGFKHCKDRAFNKLLDTLREWFPVSNP